MRALLLAVSLVVLPTAVLAQAAIAGVVLDTSGAAVAGVVVEASSPELIEKLRTTISDESGRYRLENLRPGSLGRNLSGYGPDAALFQDHCGDRTVTIRSRYWSFSHVMLVLAVILCELAPASVAWAADEHKRILVLYSTRRDAEFSIVGEDVLPKILDVGLGRDLDYYSEFIDVTRFPDPSYRVAFGDFIRLKYQGVAFDLVIAMGDVAAAFVDTDRVRLFQKPRSCSWRTIATLESPATRVDSFSNVTSLGHSA